MDDRNNGEKPLSTPTLMDYEAVQKYLGNVSRSTVKTLAARGEIEAIRISDRRTAFIAESLDRYIERQRERRRSEAVA